GGEEPPVIQLLGGIAQILRGPRRQDLLPAPVALAPEGGRPGLVQRIESAVSEAQPAAERRGTVIAETPSAIFIVYMPQAQCRVGRVARGELRGDAAAGGAVGRGIDAVRVAGAVHESHALAGLRHRVGMLAREPRWWRRGGCGKGDADACLVDRVE